MTDIAEVESQLHEATVAVDAADTLIGQGKIIDLAALERHVDTLCAAIAKLPPANCAGLKPALIMLIDGLNNLARKLADQQGEVAGRLQGLSSHRKAVSAYAGGPARPGRTRSD